MRENKFKIQMVMFNVLFVSLFSFVALFTVGQGAMSNSALYRDRVFMLETSDYHFKVYDPLTSQLNEIVNDESVFDIFPYYMRKGSVTTSSSLQSINMIAIFSNTSYNLELTEFNTHRLIEQSEINSSKPLYIDYKLSINLGLKLGDDVNVFITGLGTVKFTVDRIYENNREFSESVVYFNLDENLTDMFFAETEDINYSGIYVQAVNYQSALNYLNNYVPLGRMSPRSNYDTEEQYQNALMNFVDFNRGEKYDKNEALSVAIENNRSILTSVANNTLTLSIIMGVLLLITSVKVIFGSKHINKVEYASESRVNRKQYILIYIIADVLNFITAFALLLVFNNQVGLTYGNHQSLLFNQVTIVIASVSILNILISIMIPKLSE